MMMVTWPTINRELELIASGVEYIVGVDEVGAGSLAGPVTVCAVKIHKDFFLNGLHEKYPARDSKSLSSPQREKFFIQVLKNKEFDFSIASVSPQRIDEINILNATHEVVVEAIAKLKMHDKDKHHVLMDGNKEIRNLKSPQSFVVSGDANIFSIATASIIAKVSRDNEMRSVSEFFPEYGFAKHKGYGTKDHFKKIAEHGICPLHRRSFLKSV